jgi:hypothetical protein
MVVHSSIDGLLKSSILVSLLSIKSKKCPTGGFSSQANALRYTEAAVFLPAASPFYVGFETTV